MNINIVALALLVVTGVPTSGFAAVMPSTANQQAVIYSRDASSRFLANSYMPGLELSDDGFPGPGEPAKDPSAESAPTSGSQASRYGLAASQTSSRSGPTLAEVIDNVSSFDRTGQDGMTHTIGFDGGGFNDLTPVPQLSTVPLPASSALFGAALLVLASLGYGLRGRASRQM